MIPVPAKESDHVRAGVPARGGAVSPGRRRWTPSGGPPSSTRPAAATPRCGRPCRNCWTTTRRTPPRPSSPAPSPGRPADGPEAPTLPGAARGRRPAADRPRLRDAGGAGPRRHGRGVQGPADQSQPHRRAENAAAAGAGPTRSRSPASAPRPRSSPACTTRTSCRFTTSASAKARPYFTMEYVPGPTWPGSSTAGRKTPPPPPGSSKCWPGPCTPPTECGVVHRDLKPANVLLGLPAGGRSHDHPRGLRAAHHRLRPGQGHDRRRGPDPNRRGRWGRPCYMAPEQARGDARKRSAPPRTFTHSERSCTRC